MQELALYILGGRGPLFPLTAFMAAGVLVFVVASRLARHADAVADATGIGRLWIGTGSMRIESMAILLAYGGAVWILAS